MAAHRIGTPRRTACRFSWRRTQNTSRSNCRYRHNQLGKAIENAEKLGFTDGAALYPMVTMNGEECHNEWEITFEEIHRNGAMILALRNHEAYTGDTTYLAKEGVEVAWLWRFWAQRVHWSAHREVRDAGGDGAQRVREQRQQQLVHELPRGVVLEVRGGIGPPIPRGGGRTSLPNGPTSPRGCACLNKRHPHSSAARRLLTRTSCQLGVA